MYTDTLGTCCPVQAWTPYPLAPLRARACSRQQPYAPSTSRARSGSTRASKRPRAAPATPPTDCSAWGQGFGCRRREPHPLATSREVPVDGDAGERAGGARVRGEASATREGEGRAHWEPPGEPGAAADELAASPAKVQMALRPESGGREEPVAGAGREKNSRRI